MRAKQRLRSCLVKVGRSWPHRSAGRVVALLYHSVHPSKPFSSATPSQFKEHLGWLKDNCQLISLTDVPRYAACGHNTNPVVAVTFDDGYADNYDHAFPLLVDLGIPATFFVTVGLLEKDPEVVERCRTLVKGVQEDVRGLEWSQVLEMRQAGMEFGSHTYSHLNLARLDRANARSELARSKKLIEDRLGEPVASVAYPFGRIKRHFTPDTVDIAREVGYGYGAAVALRAVRPTDCPFSIARFWVIDDDVVSLEDKVRGAYDFLSPFQEHLPLWAARRLTPEDFRV